MVQPVEGGSACRREGLPARRAPIPPLLLTMNADVPSPLLPLVTAVPVRAKYGGRVHVACAPGRVSKTRLASACRTRPVRAIGHPLPRFSGVVPYHATGSVLDIYDKRRTSPVGDEGVEGERGWFGKADIGHPKISDHDQPLLHPRFGLLRHVPCSQRRTANDEL